MPSPPPSLAVCIVSPHQFLIRELTLVLAAAHVEVSSHHIAYSLAPQLDCACSPDDHVWLIDACLPAQSTEALVSALRKAHPGCKLVAVAEALTEELVFPLLRAGVRGFLTYADTHARLAQAVAAVAQGRVWMPRARMAGFLEALLAQGPSARSGPNWLILSQREKDVLGLLLQSLSNKEIASRLNISERTVKFHVSNLLAKFDVEKRADLILQALRGWHPA